MRSALIVGGGGRESAIGQSISKNVDAVFFAPGNAGTELIDNGFNLPFGPNKFDLIEQHIKDFNIDLTVIGPEQPLIDGIADYLKDYSVFGPHAEAAQLEGSKATGMKFMVKNKIPHPKFTIIENDKLLNETLNSFNDNNAADSVLKANGPAGGKGVVLPETADGAKRTLLGMYDGTLFEGAGKGCVIKQERLSGPELSVHVICDGKNFYTLPYVQDHKRLKDLDEGPNTGGMGAYSPVPDYLVSPGQRAKIDEIVSKTVAGTKDFEQSFRGVFFIGIMLAEEYGGDPVVIEYNVRFGDPESEVLFPLMQRCGVNTFELLKSTAEGKLHPNLIPKIGGAALTICLAAEGYPESPIRGDEIYGLEGNYKDVIIHHGATAQEGDKIVTAGGRVIFITGLGDTVKIASGNAKAALGEQGVHFRGMQCRKDIGHWALST
jgi:phosphoribosylamine--glycine ligase